jgi:hypothetical protein
MKTQVTCALALWAGAAMAHPHTSVDQQVHLSLGLEGIEIAVLIVPAATDGATTREVLDLDGDGSLDPAEAAVFRDTVLTNLEMTLNGAPMTLETHAIVHDPLSALADGLGHIRITAQAPLTTDLQSLTVAIHYDGLGPNWFIQPFYSSDLPAPWPQVLRSDDTRQIELRK